MKVFVKKVNGNAFKLTLEKTDSIRTVKKKVNEKRQIPPDKQVLTFNGKKLEDDSTLSECNIVEESTIELAMRVQHGQPCLFSFSDLNEKNKHKSSFFSEAPQYQQIQKGLTLLTECLSA
jgi:hypothetical protein